MRRRLCDVTADELGGADLRIIRCARLEGASGEWDYDVPLLRRRPCHRGGRHRLRAHGARPWRARTSKPGWTTRPRSKRAAFRYDDSLHRATRTGFFTEAASCLSSAGRRVIFTDKGKFGDANRRGHRQALSHSRRPDPGARPSEAIRLSAFLAIEGAGHLPQHAAMVHCHGPVTVEGDGSHGRTLRARALKAIDPTRAGVPARPPRGENRIRAHDRNPARTG